MSITLAAEHPFSHLSRQVNRALDKLQGGYYGFCPSETWTPSVNLYETDEAYFVCVDLAGVEKEKIDVTVEGAVLKLRGARPVPALPDIDHTLAPVRRMRVHVMEIDHGSFCREVELPEDADAEHIVATYVNGMLWVRMPRRKM